ncbi:M20/M25/M40 family metallo-hydrolase [Lactobacillus pasteurii]|uniref:Peptidase M20 n=1 Tax=Lactobacillus pasteurii DSM 23907 = CRBIP 24.76 TaxID=1423790 RepID=I7JZ60_9LACO|nr:M20/M25/M40 family metallo-hydrolase [Lactobacillus pasteurii]TDG78146.1 hypothetical protein C5L33_000209 [Lactobacillus pasteurii]CCI86045.1 Peptidase M20 [Lactobacillus pasteurii DSM 23907 = CRBIP 24.76]
MTSLTEFARAHFKDYDEFFELKTIAAQHLNQKETADWLIAKFKELKADVVEEWNDHGGPSNIFAEFKADSDKTVLFYNHYDTQPEGDVNDWDSDPYQVTVKDGKLIVRGALDDKGELVTRLILIDYLKQTNQLPVNVKFFVEGEEEIGSSHIVEYTNAYQERLKADLCIWEGGAKNSKGKLVVSGGLKGVSCIEVGVETANTDLHSSQASYAESAPWRLVQGLATLREVGTNRILIDGIYDDVDSISDEEKQYVEGYEFDPDKISQDSELARPLLTDDPKLALVNEPTITINGLTSGYQKEGVKTVLPRFAKAKIDFRLSPNQDPERVAQLTQQQLIKNGFSDLKVKYLVGQPGYRADITDPVIRLVLEQAKEVYGPTGVQYVLNDFVAGPAYAFGRNLGLPLINYGIGNSSSNMHGANENVLFSDIEQVLILHERILREVNKQG